MESKNVPNQLSAPLSSINIKHEVDSTSAECKAEKDSKDLRVPAYKIESTSIKTEPMFLPFPYDTKEHLKVESMHKDSKSDNLLKSSEFVSIESNVTEATISKFGHVKKEKYHDDDNVGPNTRYETNSDTTRYIAQSGSSESKEQRDASEINILSQHLEIKLLESAGSSSIEEVGLIKRSTNPHHSKEKSYKCDICQKYFSRKEHMMRHQLTHTKEKPFPCDICEKSFSTKGNLNIHHQSVHSDAKPYQCDICQKSFSLKQNMMRHKLTHTDEKQFQCDICEKSFSRKSSLNTHHQSVHSEVRHKLKHTNQKSYKCDTCQKSFSQKGSLKTHFHSVHSKVRRYQCEICQKSYSLRSSMLRHKLTHTSDKQLHCDICQKSFTRKLNLKLHRQNVHINERP